VSYCGVKQEVVDEMTSQTAGVVRRHDRNAVSDVPPAFRRSDDATSVVCYSSLYSKQNDCNRLISLLSHGHGHIDCVWFMIL